MKCKTVRKYFNSYLSDTLHHTLRSAVERHIADCRQCREDFKTQSEMRMLLRNMPAVVRSESYYEGLKRSIHHKLMERETGEPLKYSRDYVPPRIKVYSFAAVFLIMLASVLFYISDYSEDAMLTENGLNGEEIDFYLEEHEFSQGCNALVQSAFAGLIMQEREETKENGAE